MYCQPYAAQTPQPPKKKTTTNKPTHKTTNLQDNFLKEVVWRSGLDARFKDWQVVGLNPA